MDILVVYHLFMCGFFYFVGITYIKSYLKILTHTLAGRLEAVGNGQLHSDS